MSSLYGFSCLSPEGHIPLCEMEGKVQSMPAEHADLNLFTKTVTGLPNVAITRELLHSSMYRDELQDVFVPVQEAIVKKLVNLWYEHGLMEVLQTMADPEQESISPLVRKLAWYMLKVANGITRLRNTFHPHLRESGPKLVNAVSQTRDWARSPVRCMAWHPHTTKLAVAAWDDSVRVFSSHTSLVPVLKCKEQRTVACMAWRPLSASEIAVGCEAGVLVWQVDPNSVVTHPSTSCATLLTRPRHSPVTSVAWSPQGDLLLSASAADTCMYVWDVAMERFSAVRRVGGGGVCLAYWAPDSARLFAATSGIIFRVWETLKWVPERWTVMSGRIQTACWSPCGSLLLFATSEEPFIYSLAFTLLPTVFQSDSDALSRAALRAVDLTPVDLESGDRVGGLVVTMVWDPTGHYLAIMFQCSDVIAVFKTQITPLLHITPCCLVNGGSGEAPNTIAFQQDFKDGAVLTIAWSSGRVQHFPIVCTELTSPTAATVRPMDSILSPRAHLNPMTSLRSSFMSS